MLNIEKAKKYLKNLKEDIGSAIAEIMELDNVSIYVEDAFDDMTPDETIVKEDANKSKGKPVISEALKSCYYSIKLAWLNRKLNHQQKKEEQLEPKLNKTLDKIDTNALASGIDLLSDRVRDDKIKVYRNYHTSEEKIQSDIERAQQEIQDTQQKKENIQNSVFSDDNMSLLDQSPTIEPMNSIELERVMEETSEQLKEDVQSITNSETEPIMEENKTSSTDDKYDSQIELIVASLYEKLDAMYNLINEDMETKIRSLHDETAKSYQQMKKEVEIATRDLVESKESQRIEDIQTITATAEEQIRNTGAKLESAKARQKETDANLKRAEDTIITQNHTIETMQGQISDLNTAMATKDKEIEALKQELSIQQQQNRQLNQMNKKYIIAIDALRGLGENPSHDINMDSLISDPTQTAKKL